MMHSKLKKVFTPFLLILVMNLCLGWPIGPSIDRGVVLATEATDPLADSAVKIVGSDLTTYVHNDSKPIVFTLRPNRQGIKIKQVSIHSSSDPQKFPLEESKFDFQATITQHPDIEDVVVSFGEYTVNPEAKDGIYYIRLIVTYEETVNGQPQAKKQELDYRVQIGSSDEVVAPPDKDEGETKPTRDPNKPPGEGVEKPALPDPVNRKSMLMVKEGDVPRLELGQEINLVLPIINRGDQYVRIVNIQPQTPLDENFPFEILKSDYTKQLELLLAPQGALGLDLYGTCVDASIDFGPMYVKSDLKKGYYKVDFLVKYQDFMTKKDIIYYNEYEGLYYSHEGYKITLPEEFSEVTLSLIFYVNGVGEEKPTEEVKIPTPRLISKGFTTTPEQIMGGDKFRLRLTLENTSTVTAVQNVRLSFDSGEGAPFLPTDGATTKYIDYIAAGGQYELILDLQASANLEEKIYPLNLKMEYEDYAAKVYNAEETLSLQLHQETRVGISGVEAYPAQLSVGQEGNLTFSILNKGKNKLNNASITFPEGGAVSAPEVFLGNIDPGAAKDVDISIMPENPTNGEKIKIQIHYEDSNGQPKIIEEELSLEVVEAMPPDDMYPPEGEFPGEPGEFPGGDDEGGSKFPIWAWILIILALLIALIAVLTALMRKRRRQKQAEEDAEFFRQLEEERQNRNPGASPKTSPNGQNGHGSKAQNANTPKASNGNGSKSSNGNGSRPGGGSVGPAKSDRQAPRRR